MHYHFLKPFLSFLAPLVTSLERRYKVCSYCRSSSIYKILLAKLPALRLLSASDGAGGLEQASRGQPDLVLLDMHLPDLHGDMLLRRPKENERTRTIPVVMIIADATLGQHGRLLALGADAYLTKPLDIVEFLQAVDQHSPPGKKMPAGNLGKLDPKTAPAAAATAGRRAFSI